MPAASSSVRKGTGGFARNILTVTGGSTIAYGAYLLATPITSRYFGPNEFGLAALFQSGATILGRIACLRYENALVLPKEEGEAAAILGVCGISLAGTTLIASLLTWLFGDSALALLNGAELAPLLWLLPIQGMLYGAEQLFLFWNTRHKRFQLVAAGRILFQTPMAGLEIGGGAAGLRSGPNLVVLRVVSMIVAPIYLLYRVVWEDGRFVRAHLNWTAIAASARRYIKFPLFDFWSIFMNIGAWHAPVFLMAAFFSPSVGGLYTKAVLLLYLPGLLLGESVGQVFLQLAAAKRADGQSLAGVFEMVFNRMISVGTLPFALLAIVGPELFGVFLGSQWAEAGIYARLLAPWMFMFLLFSAVRTLFATLERQGIFMVFNAFLLASRIGVLVLGGTVLRNIPATLLMLGILGAVTISFICLYLMRLVRCSPWKPIRHFLICALVSCPILVVVAALKWWLHLGPVFLLAWTLVASLPYAAFIVYIDRELQGVFLRIAERLKAAR